MLPGAVRYEQFRGVFLRLIQFSAVMLAVHSDLNYDIFIGSRHWWIRRVTFSFP